jgi:hypothetical protein
VDIPKTAAGLTCDFVHSASLHFFPSSHGSSLKTIPLCSSATGDGCEYGHRALLHPMEYRQRAFEDGFSGIGPGAEDGLGVMADTEWPPSFVPWGTFTGAERVGGVGAVCSFSC